MSGKRITVLVSGRGSNLAALFAAMDVGALAGAITEVICNNPAAEALNIARRRAVAASVVDHRAFATRAAFDSALMAAIDGGTPDLVVLAGFMRILGPAVVRRYEGRLLNIHPSLLPAYPGLHTHRRALADGVRVHGCTVHFVTPEVDVGPIVAQGVVPVLAADDEAALAARVLAVEHQLLPAAVRWFCSGQLVIAAGRVNVIKQGAAETAQLLSPPP